MVISTAGLLYGLKAFLAGTIFFVWVVRYQNIKEEFKVYRLPIWLRDLVGVLKLSFTTNLLLRTSLPFNISIGEISD